MKNADICRRYLLPVIPHPPNERIPFLVYALATTVAISQDTANRSATILCSAKSVFKSTMVNVLSPKTLTALLNGKAPEIYDHVFMKLETTITMNKTPLATTVLCLFAHENMLEKLGAHKAVASLIVAPADQVTYDYCNNKWSPQLLKKTL